MRWRYEENCFAINSSGSATERVRDETQNPALPCCVGVCAALALLVYNAHYNPVSMSGTGLPAVTDQQ